MWFDFASDEGIQVAVAHNHRRLIKDLRDHGFAVAKGVVPEADCAAAVRAYDRYLRALNKENPTRFQNAHLVIPEILKVATHRKTREILQSVFLDEPALWSTLLFMFGSQQETHVDGPYFATDPESTFVGVWTALEPVALDAGPLFYWDCGHRYQVDPIDSAHRWANHFASHSFWDEPDWWSLYNFKSDSRFDVSLWNWYQSEVLTRCVNAGLTRRVALLEPGDVLIWHPLLPHGGDPIAELGHTRRSVVSHYVPRNSRVGGPDVFHGVRLNFLNSPCQVVGDEGALVFHQGHGFGGS